MSFLEQVCDAALSLFLSETCQLCGRLPGETGWVGRGRCVRGLRAVDRPHLCAECGRSLVQTVRTRCVDSLLIVGAGGVEAELVRVLGAWKYHGLRGLAWPLADLLNAAASIATQRAGEVDALVPIPLHASRRRWRGFNQAELLAGLLSEDMGVPCFAGVVRRCRNTAQQARISSSSGLRADNVVGAFQAVPADDRTRCRVGLIDDVVTSGATVVSCARALRREGWEVSWALSVGLVDGVEVE